MANEVAKIETRLPVPQGTDAGLWRVLTESIFPSARTSQSVQMAIDYCKHRKLDILKKPVHIVPMWSSSLKKEVETVWPSINEIQTTASRTGQWAGMDEPQWGAIKKRTFKGKRKYDQVGDSEVTVEYPEWCSITVYRMINGQRCPFTEPVYWEEAYAHIGKSELPNDMWCKRIRGQHIKVAKAASLRAAFPEEAGYSAEEMEGKTLEEYDANGIVIDGNEPLKKASPFKNSAARKQYFFDIVERFSKAATLEELRDVITLNKPKIDELEKNGHEYDLSAIEQLRNDYEIAANRITGKYDKTPAEDIGTFTEEEIELQQASRLRSKA